MRRYEISGRVFRSFAILLVVLPSIVYGGTWTSDSVEEGGGGLLCKALHKRLQEIRPECASDAIESYKEFSDPPWQSLDPAEHLGLITKLMMLAQEGARAYFKNPEMSHDAAHELEARRFIERGGQLQVWRTHLISFLHAGSQKVPPREQTIIRLTNKVGSDNSLCGCPGKSSIGWVRSTFIVLPDLSGPDPQIDPGTAGVLATRWPVFYEGQTMLINSHSVFRAEPYGVCSFDYVDVAPHSKKGK